MSIAIHVSSQAFCNPQFLRASSATQRQSLSTTEKHEYARTPLKNNRQTAESAASKHCAKKRSATFQTTRSSKVSTRRRLGLCQPSKIYQSFRATSTSCRGLALARLWPRSIFSQHVPPCQLSSSRHLLICVLHFRKSSTPREKNVPKSWSFHSCLVNNFPSDAEENAGRQCTSNISTLCSVFAED